jgi:hypothetical protein
MLHLNHCTLSAVMALVFWLAVSASIAFYFGVVYRTGNYAWPKSLWRSRGSMRRAGYPALHTNSNEAWRHQLR